MRGINDGLQQAMRTTIVMVACFLLLTAASYAQRRGTTSEIQVNSYTADDQGLPSVATGPNGDFVVVWQSPQDGYSYGIMGRRYSASGSPLGNEFHVNTYTIGNQLRPVAASDADGNFIVVWFSTGSNGDDLDYSIQARLFAADGTPLGDDFQVNSDTTSWQLNPDVAMAPSGDFVVAWQSNSSYSTDTSQASIQARRFAADGTPYGYDFQVNTYTTYDQQEPAVDVADDGSFVIAWQSLLQDGVGDGIYAQRFDADGDPVGTEFQVNTYTFMFQSNASVAMAPEGDFVIAWQSDYQDNSNTSVQARIYDADGTPAGDEFQVNSYIDNHQNYPEVAANGEGDFLVVWQSYGSSGTDDMDFSIQARRYSFNGSPVGTQFQINSYIPDIQGSPVVALSDSAAAGFVVTWESRLQDGSDYGVYAQHFSLPKAFTDASKEGTAELEE